MVKHSWRCQWEYDEAINFAESKCGYIYTEKMEFKKVKFCPYCGRLIELSDNSTHDMLFIRKILTETGGY